MYLSPNSHVLSSSRSLQWVLLAITSLAILARAASSAWVGEDALITFRVIDNFVNGHGLRWNVDQRVQVYTHPLWMLLNACAYFFTREVPYTATALGLGFSLAAYGAAARRLVQQSPILLATFFIPIVLSKSLTLYSTSGFETSLTLFLLSAFSVTLLGSGGKQGTPWALLSLLAALGCTARLDNVLLYAPALLVVCVVGRHEIRWGRFVLGLAPLFAWIGFSLFYYGFAYPNTAPAKLSPDFPLAGYVREGLGYGVDLARNDPVSAVALGLGMLTTVGCIARLRCDPRDALAGRLAGLGVGALLYGLYVVRIGGGFLSGRFWILPIYASVLVFAFGLPTVIRQLRSAPVQTAGAMALVAAITGLACAGAVHVPTQGPIHEKSLAHLYLRRDLSWAPTETAVKFRRAGERHRELASRDPGNYVGVIDVIGFAGFAAGPEVTLIDVYALADPLLARLPLDPYAHWRIGHLPRRIPPGYLFARRTGSLDQLEPGIREYYAKLSLLTSSPLLGWERMRAIVGFNLGRYDALLDGTEAQGSSASDGNSGTGTNSSLPPST